MERGPNTTPDRFTEVFGENADKIVEEDGRFFLEGHELVYDPDENVIYGVVGSKELSQPIDSINRFDAVFDD